MCLILINNDTRLFNGKFIIAITEYCNIFKKLFYRTSLVTASELKSNISNANLDKSKLFLYFDTSHANQTKNSYIS